MDKLNHWRTGGATALTVGALSLVCAFAVWLSPEGTVSFVNSWTHGLDLTVLRVEKPWTWGGLACGLFNVTLIGFLAGMLFACCYNLAGKCACCCGKGNKHA